MMVKVGGFFERVRQMSSYVSARLGAVPGTGSFATRRRSFEWQQRVRAGWCSWVLMGRSCGPFILFWGDIGPLFSRLFLEWVCLARPPDLQGRPELLAGFQNTDNGSGGKEWCWVCSVPLSFYCIWTVFWPQLCLKTSSVTVCVMCNWQLLYVCCLWVGGGAFTTL